MKECTDSFRIKVAIILFLFRIYNVVYLIIILTQSKATSEKVHEYFKFSGEKQIKRSRYETLYRNKKEPGDFSPGPLMDSFQRMYGQVLVLDPLLLISSIVVSILIVSKVNDATITIC